jgi:surface antigen
VFVSAAVQHDRYSVWLKIPDGWILERAVDSRSRSGSSIGEREVYVVPTAETGTSFSVTASLSKESRRSNSHSHSHSHSYSVTRSPLNWRESDSTLSHGDFLQSPYQHRHQHELNYEQHLIDDRLAGSADGGADRHRTPRSSKGKDKGRSSMGDDEDGSLLPRGERWTPRTKMPNATKSHSSGGGIDRSSHGSSSRRNAPFSANLSRYEDDMVFGNDPAHYVNRLHDAEAPEGDDVAEEERATLQWMKERSHEESLNLPPSNSRFAASADLQQRLEDVNRVMGNLAASPHPRNISRNCTGSASAARKTPSSAQRIANHRALSAMQSNMEVVTRNLAHLTEAVLLCQTTLSSMIIGALFILVIYCICFIVFLAPFVLLD